MNDFSVIIIGGGSAGFAAAGRAVEGGAKTALVEADKLGGACPHNACVPTKMLLETAGLLEEMTRAPAYGVDAGEISLDFKRVMAGKNAVIDQLTGERLKRVLDKRGISLFTGRAVFTSPEAIDLDGQAVTADKFIIATGSIPFIPPIRGLREAGYITNNEALNLKELPGSIAIVGGGPVGVEFARIFNRFGVETTLIEAGLRLLGGEDAEISELLQTYLLEQGIDVITGVEVGAVTAAPGRKSIQVAAPSGLREVSVDELMIATGRSPAVEDLRLSAAGVEYDRHGVKVDDTLKTSAANIWACGDVTGRFFLTQLATYQGDIAGFNAMAEEPDHADYSVIPHVTFSDPEVAGVGLTETEAVAAGHDVRIGRMPYRYLGRALIAGESRGLVKLIVDGSTRLILGGRIIGVRAGELIHEIAVAIKAGMSVDELAAVVHAYPTLAEGIEAAAADAAQAAGPAEEEQAA